MILGLKCYFIIGFFPNKISYLSLLNRLNYGKTSAKLKFEGLISYKTRLNQAKKIQKSH